jgi:hypothetical protein
VERSMFVPSAMQVEISVLRDARSTHDVASLSFDDYEVGGQPMWRLATVSPDAKSGSGTVPGGYFEADGGKLVVPSGAQALIVKAGTWKALASSPPGNSSLGGGFSWYEPMSDKRVLAAEDYYSPFVHGGLLFFTPVPAKADIDQFGSARLLFSTWARDVSAAFTFYRANRRFFEVTQRAVAAQQLKKLVSGDNRLLAVAAWRSLLARGGIQPNWVSAQLARASGPRGAVFGYLSIVITASNGSQPFAQAALGAVDRAGVPSLRALMLGAFAAGLLRSRESKIVEQSRSVLVKGRHRLAALGVIVHDDARLSVMFDKMGI